MEQAKKKRTLQFLHLLLARVLIKTKTSKIFICLLLNFFFLSGSAKVLFPVRALLFFLPGHVLRV